MSELRFRGSDSQYVGEQSGCFFWQSNSVGTSNSRGNEAELAPNLSPRCSHFALWYSSILSQWLGERRSILVILVSISSRWLLRHHKDIASGQSILILRLRLPAFRGSSRRAAFCARRGAAAGA